MEKVLIYNHIIKVRGVKKKVLYHFSDTHLSEYDSLSDNTEKEKATELSASWEKQRIYFAQKHAEPYGELQKQSAREHFENIIDAVKDADAVMAAGDLMEYVNDANLRFLEKTLEKLTIPFVAVCGNHENADDIPDGFIISEIKKSVQILELGDMTVFAIDNSKRRITKEQLDCLKSLLEKDKPIIVLMPVPIMTEENKALLTDCGEYFQLNYNGAHKENFEFTELIKNSSGKIIAVCAGHLHFKDTSTIADGITQYISSQGIAGNINRYEIGE